MQRVIAILSLLALVACGIEPTQGAHAQASGMGPGLAKCSPSGLLSGACTISSPLTATITVDGTSVTGTGSAGSPLSSLIPSSVYSTAFEGVYGPGTDGALVFDGSTSLTLSGGNDAITGPTAGTGKFAGYNVYTLPHDMLATSITVNSGVAINTGGYRIFANSTLTNNGLIHRSGSNASGTGAQSAPAFAGCGGGTAGGASGAVGTATTSNLAAWTTANSTSTAGSTNSAGINGQVLFKGGGGGGSSVGVGFTSGATALKASTAGSLDFIVVMSCRFSDRSLSAPQGGSGGGGGGNAATGGSGGPGAGVIAVYARQITGSGIFQATGGNGGNATATSGGGGGGGGGGAAIIVYSHRTGSFTVDVSGGTGGAAFGASSVERSAPVMPLRK